MSTPAPAVGGLRLRPGGGRCIEGGRVLPVGLLLAGRPAAEAPALLGCLFALCGRAHALASSLALGAAAGDASAASPAQQAALRQEVLREQLRHLWIDWPLHLAGAAPGAREQVQLANLLRSAASEEGELQPALATALYGCAVGAWLQRCAQERLTDGLVADAAPVGALLGAARLARGLKIETGDCLEALCEAPVWAALAEDALSRPEFAARPSVAGRCLQTGAFARVAGRRGRPAETVFDRLFDRLEDLAALLLRQQDPATGALDLGRGRGLAWVDTARGRLIHVAALDRAGRIGGYCVIAPTEWNFHPDGALARALAQLPLHGSTRSCQALALAADPCLNFSVLPAQALEAAGA